MKCYVCGYEVPAGKKFCPGCGRVISSKDMERAGDAYRKSAPDSFGASDTTRGYKTNSSQSRTPDYRQAPPQSRTPDYRQAPSQSRTPDYRQAPPQSRTPDYRQAPSQSRTPDYRQAPSQSRTPDYRQAPSQSRSPDYRQAPSQSRTADYRPEPPRSNGSVYRPAASKSEPRAEKTTKIPDIFRTDPNAPEYSDPHSYDRATADIMQYDRMFINKKSGYKDESDDDMKIYDAPQQQYDDSFGNSYYDNDNEYDDGNDYQEQYDDDDEIEENVSKKSKSYVKPHLNINGKILAVCIAVILGIIICVTGIYKIGKQFGAWGTKEKTTSSATVSEEMSSQQEQNTTAKNSTDKIGVYTVNTDQKNIFVYKEPDTQRLTATIPADTVIEVTEISGNYGKVTYNSYTGWVSLSDLKYTPNAVATTSPSNTSDSDDDTPSPYPTEIGEYRVTMNGDGDSVNVRSEPSTSGVLLTTVTDGTAVTVTEIQGDWGKVNIDGIDGWIYMKYLSK